MPDSRMIDFDVLLVEDNPGDRDLLLEYLEASGKSFHVETAESLGQALKN